MIEITYHKEGDYFIPNLYLAKEEYKKDYQIGMSFIIAFHILYNQSL